MNFKYDVKFFNYSIFRANNKIFNQNLGYGSQIKKFMLSIYYLKKK